MHYTSPEVYEFISKQTNPAKDGAGDPIVERKTCRVSGTKFAIFQSDVAFYEKISPVFNGKKYSIPTPTLCPEERQRRRLMFRNERKLYKRKCDATGETIISIYPTTSAHTVYHKDYRIGDGWDPMSYGIDIDTSKSYTEHIQKLYNTCPHSSLINVGNENAEYANHCGRNKNSYLLFYSDYNEDCAYLDHGFYNHQCYDSSYTNSCKRVYSLMDCRDCYNGYFLQGCTSCRNTMFSFNCKDCEYCLLCSNLVSKKYCYKNEQLTEAEYSAILEKFSLLSLEEKYDMYKKTFDEAIKPSSTIIGSEQSCGNKLENMSNCHFCYNSRECKDSKWLYDSSGCNDCYDFSGFGSNNTSLVYESTTVGVNTSNILFCRGVFVNVSNILYSSFCQDNCHHLFGCIGLRNKEYCIFNKQYTKEEYETLVPKIIGQMQETGERGEFFDPSLSPFGYNETVAQEYFPLTRDKALARGYTRQDKNYDPVIPEGVETLTGDQIPSDIATVDDSILKKIFICEASGRPFRIIKQELEFYRTHTIPLPRKHPDVRHEERLAKRPGRKLHLRTCDKTGEAILSVYPPNVNFKVYSEEAYQQEVYG